MNTTPTPPASGLSVERPTPAQVHSMCVYLSDKCTCNLCPAVIGTEYGDGEPLCYGIALETLEKAREILALDARLGEAEKASAEARCFGFKHITDKSARPYKLIACPGCPDCQPSPVPAAQLGEAEVHADVAEVVEALRILSNAALPYRIREPVDRAIVLLERLSDDGWQPIETAPRDGTRILACNTEHGYCLVGYFRGAHFTDGAFPLIDVTHWRPLPPPYAPPSTAEKGEK